MAVPDPSAVRAVLIGIEGYRRLPPLPSVGPAVRRIAELLREPTVLGLPAEHVTVLGAAATGTEVLARVRDAAAADPELLLVLFAGHGLRDHEGRQLFLALRDADDEHPAIGSIPYPVLRDVLRRAGYRVRRTIVILDCCYSGLAGEMGASQVTPGELSRMVRAGAAVADDSTERDLGIYLLTSAPAHGRSLAPSHARYPEFGGELIDILEHGIPGAGPTLTPDAVWRVIRARSAARNSPLPQQFGRNAAAHQEWLYNRAGLAPLPASAIPGAATAPPGTASRAVEPGPVPAPVPVPVSAPVPVPGRLEAPGPPVEGPPRVPGRRSRHRVLVVAAVALTGVVAVLVAAPHWYGRSTEDHARRSPSPSARTSATQGGGGSATANSASAGATSPGRRVLGRYEARAPGPNCAQDGARWTVPEGSVGCTSTGATYTWDAGHKSPYASLSLPGYTLPNEYQVTLQASRLNPTTCVAVVVKDNIGMGACATGDCYITRSGSTAVSLASRKFAHPATLVDLVVRVDGNALTLTVSSNNDGDSITLDARDPGRNATADIRVGVHTINSAAPYALITDFRIDALG
ncbi:caspase, EACC1-associated type [Embleya sp. NPDC001921]